MKTCFITGGNKGIGKGVADVFIRNGYNIFITGRSESDNQKAFADVVAVGRLQTGNPGASYYTCDVTSVDEMRQAVKKCVDLFGGVDVLIVNAGNVKSDKIMTLSLSLSL